jgi:hypothetical protein
MSAHTKGSTSASRMITPKVTMMQKRPETLEELKSEKVLVVTQALSSSWMQLSMLLLASAVDYAVEFVDADGCWSSVLALNKQLGGQLQYPVIIQV